MVLSTINSNVSYEESPAVQASDFRSVENNLNRGVVHKNDVYVVIGVPQNTFRSEGVLYRSYYLITKQPNGNAMPVRIGVCEINSQASLDTLNTVAKWKRRLFAAATPSYVASHKWPVEDNLSSANFSLRPSSKRPQSHIIDLTDDTPTKKPRTFASLTKSLETVKIPPRPMSFLSTTFVPPSVDNNSIRWGRPPTKEASRRTDSSDFSGEDEDEEDEEEDEEEEEEEEEEDKEGKEEKEEEKNNSLEEKLRRVMSQPQSSLSHSRDYTPAVTDNWLQKYFKDPEYSIQDNRGNGDCLFASIADAFANTNQRTTVANLRSILADSMRNDDLQMYKSMYQDTTGTYNHLVEQRNHLATQSRVTNDPKELNALIREYDKIEMEEGKAKQLADEFAFMNKVNTLDDLKRRVQSQDYWADSIAIKHLQDVLDIKIIVLSQDAYGSSSFHEIVQCGEAMSHPARFVIVDYGGSHYRLVKYNERGLFLFENLPTKLKQLIVNTCRNAVLNGEWGEDFRRYAQSQGGTRKQKRGGGKQTREKGRQGRQGKTKRKRSSSLGTPARMKEWTDSDLLHLYNDDICFCFSSVRTDQAPGRGKGERIPTLERPLFLTLSRVPNWRQQLSPEWVRVDTDGLFALDGLHWASVEHYCQAQKFKERYPEYYRKFALESSDPLSKQVSLAKAAGSPSGKWKQRTIRPSSIRLDTNLPQRSKKAFERAQQAKFDQNDDLREMLVSTRDAKLEHIVSSTAAPVLADHLMKLRRRYMDEDTLA